MLCLLHHMFLVMISKHYCPLWDWAWGESWDRTIWSLCECIVYTQDVSININQISNGNSLKKHTVIYSFQTDCSATTIFILCSTVYLDPSPERPFRVVIKLYLLFVCIWSHKNRFLKLQKVKIGNENVTYCSIFRLNKAWAWYFVLLLTNYSS